MPFRTVFHTGERWVVNLFILCFLAVIKASADFVLITPNRPLFNQGPMVAPPSLRQFLSYVWKARLSQISGVEFKRGKKPSSGCFL